MNPARSCAGLYAIRTSYDAAAVMGADLMLRLDEVIGHALNAHAIAAENAPIGRLVEVSGHAVGAWRALAGLNDASHAPEDRALTPAVAA